MTENMIKKPVRIITGPCQTSSRQHVDYGLDLASLKVTNPDGRVVNAISGLRHCEMKSRTKLNPSREGMGLDYHDWEMYSIALMNAALKGDKLPQPPVTQGAKWAEEIQGKVPDMMLAMETMDWVHASLFAGHIQPGLGLLWLPSVMQLGEPASMIAKVASDNRWGFGAKNGKWSERKLPYDTDNMTATNLEDTAVGLLGSFALGVAGIKTVLPEVVFIERGMAVPEKGDWRNLPDHQSARIVKSLLQKEVDTYEGKKPRVTIAYDPSHANGPGRREKIVDDAVYAATEITDSSGDLLYDMILVESAPPDHLPPSDTKQQISGEEISEMVSRIAKKRPIFDRRDNLSNK